MKNIKTFEQFSFSEEEVLEEGLMDTLRGVNWYKNNWKVAFGYYKKMGNERMMELVAKRGTEEEQNDWKTAKDPEGLKRQNAFRSQLDKIENQSKGGSMIATPGSGASRSAESNQAKEAADELKKNPTIYDEEIASYLK